MKKTQFETRLAVVEELHQGGGEAVRRPAQREVVHHHPHSEEHQHRPDQIHILAQDPHLVIKTNNYSAKRKPNIKMNSTDFSIYLVAFYVEHFETDTECCYNA